MQEKIIKAIKNKQIDDLLICLLDMKRIDINTELVEILTAFYKKEKDICNTVLFLNTLKNERSMKKRSKESGFYEYIYM